MATCRVYQLRDGNIYRTMNQNVTFIIVIDLYVTVMASGRTQCDNETLQHLVAVAGVPTAPHRGAVWRAALRD